MIRFYSFLFSMFLVALSHAQVTEDPTIKRKSTLDVFISKIDIKDNETEVSMYFLSKTPKEALREYFDSHPDEEREIRSMNPIMRELVLRDMMSKIGTSTISFQPSSYIKISDGRKMKFLRTSNIPTAPERKDVTPGKRYNFKVYFEKIPSGFQTIDLIEFKKDKSNDFTYWNFLGIKINNPAKPEEKIEDNYVDEDDGEADPTIMGASKSPLRLFGKIKDASTENTLKANIKCKLAGRFLDSLSTSKSGSYEFDLVQKDSIELEVSAIGYYTITEMISLKGLKSKSQLQRDIFLEPIIIDRAEPKKPETKEDVSKVEAPKEEIGEKTKTDAFKLDKVYFALGQSTLMDESKEQLDRLAEYLVNNINLKIQVEGHTDNQGDRDLNKKLSLDRAFNVREYLIKKGVEGKRIKFVGLGDTQPISTNNKEEDRKLNRRVEYRFIEK